MRDELAAIARLTAIFQNADDGEIGIGDDAATIATPEKGRLVWTVDEQVQNTHFKTDWLSWHDVGWRSFIAAASDIAAMGGVATRALSAIAIPPDFLDDSFDALIRGQQDAAVEIGCKIVGGNLARANEMHVTTTVIGVCDKPILRSGAKDGDDIWVSGALGLAFALRIARARTTCRERAARSRSARVASSSSALRRRKKMSVVATSAIDLSDGLARDLSHVATASGVRVELDEEALIAHGDFYGTTTAANLLGEDLLDSILFGGEDYALSRPADRRSTAFSASDRFAAEMESNAGRPRKISPRGFEYFRFLNEDASQNLEQRLLRMHPIFRLRRTRPRADHQRSRR